MLKHVGCLPRFICDWQPHEREDRVRIADPGGHGASGLLAGRVALARVPDGGPRFVPFLEMLGHVYEEKGDVMAAVAEYGKAVEVLLEDPDAEKPNWPSELFARIRSSHPVVRSHFDLRPCLTP